MLFCFRVQNFAEIGLSAAQLWPKTIFKMAAICHLEFYKFLDLRVWLSPSSKSAFVYQIFNKMG